MPNCFRLLTHWLRRAASRAAWTAGSSSAIRTAMIAITTNNSISVKPRERRGVRMGGFLGRHDKKRSGRQRSERRGRVVGKQPTTRVDTPPRASHQEGEG